MQGLLQLPTDRSQAKSMIQQINQRQNEVEEEVQRSGRKDQNQLKTVRVFVYH